MAIKGTYWHQHTKKTYGHEKEDGMPYPKESLHKESDHESEHVVHSGTWEKRKRDLPFKEDHQDNPKKQPERNGQHEPPSQPLRSFEPAF